MKKSSLALLLAAPKGDRGEYGDEKESSKEDDSESDYQELAEAAFPDEDWTPERVAALKEFVMKCTEG